MLGHPGQGLLAGSLPLGPTAGGQAPGKAHVFFLPLKFTVQFLYLLQPLPKGKFCCNPLGFKFIVGLQDRKHTKQG